MLSPRAAPRRPAAAAVQMKEDKGFFGNMMDKALLKLIEVKEKEGAKKNLQVRVTRRVEVLGPCARKSASASMVRAAAVRTREVRWPNNSRWLTVPFCEQECVFCEKGQLKCEGCEGTGYAPITRAHDCRFMRTRETQTHTCARTGDAGQL